MPSHYRLFDYTGDVEFAFNISADEAINSLNKVIYRPTVSELLVGEPANALVGQASRNFVKLSRVHPLKGNVFRPQFYGKVTDKAGTAKLAGKFRMEPIWKLVLAVPVIIFVIVGILLTTLGFGALSGSVQIEYALGGPFMIAVALAFVSFVKWLFRGDVEWISKRINALGGSAESVL